MRTLTTNSKAAKILVPVVLAFLGYCNTGYATITSASWWDDGDGALTCKTTTLSSDNSTLSMTGDQSWGPGHMNGSITTDSPGDPTLTLGSAVDNDTSFAWTSYQVNVYMNNTFTVVTGSANVTSPLADWTVASVTQDPGTVGSGPYAGDYEWTIDFSGGTPVAIGQELDFGYAINFSSSTDYAFTQEMIPVPEPNALGLLSMSGLLFGGFQRVKRSFKRN